MDEKTLLGAIGSMMDEKLTAHELRFDEKFTAQELRFDEKFAAQELRIDEKFTVQELKLDEKLTAQEDRIMNNFRILFENEVTPKFALLAEGQQMLLEKMAPRSRVDDLEEEVKLLKVFFRQMNEELRELKKAR